MLLLPSAMKLKKNPDGRTLDEVLPPAAYARWAALKQRYIGRDSSIEKERPLIVAQKLYAAAVKRSDLGGKVLSPVIDEVMKQRKMQYTPTSLKFSIKDPKAAIADFREEGINSRELACMDEMLDSIDRDLPQMLARANAWAVGDVEALRAMPRVRTDSCWSTWSETEALRKRGIEDVENRVKAQWVKIAEESLTNNLSTFAQLSMRDLLEPDGYLAKLRAKGYTVEEPM